MNELEKELQQIEKREHFLHKLVAGSAFLFALLLLPAAQYFLVTNQLPANSVAKSADSGQVAGVSTDQTIVDASFATATPEVSATPYTLEGCLAGQSKDLADLKTFEDGQKIHMYSEYNKKVASYNDALNALQGQDKPSEVAALNKLVDDQYQPYLKKLEAVESAVASQKKLIASRSCPAE